MMLNVDKLKRGLVIDHIQEGKGLDIYRELHLNEIEMPVVLMKGIASEKMGRKDLIKIETDIDLDMDVLGLIDPNVTVNYIKNGRLTKKTKISLPEKVKGILKCNNPRCISKSEDVGKITFYLVDPEKEIYRCEYCDTYTSFNEDDQN